MGGVKRPAQIVKEGFRGPVLLEFLQVRPFLGLSLLDEGKDILRKQTPLAVELAWIAFLVAARSNQVVFDGRFKSVFRMLTRHQVSLSRLHAVYM